MKLRLGRTEIDVRQTLADRVVSYFNPMAGMERLRSRAMMSVASSAGGYTGGRRDRRGMRSWRPSEASARADILPDLPDLRARSRDLIRNAPIATGAIATNVTQIVGDGLRLKANINRELLGLDDEAAEQWEQAAEREFALWSRCADFTRAQCFEEMQALAFRSSLESGDVLIVRRYRQDPGDAYGTKLQLVEADRICNQGRKADCETESGGVQFNADGVATGYSVANRHPTDLAFSKGALTWQTVPARDAEGNILARLLFERLRPDQPRGVPYLAPIIEMVKTLGEYTEHEVRAAAIAAMFTAFVTTPPPEEDAPPTIGDNNTATTAVTDPTKEIALEDAGAIVRLDQGETVEIANPGRPNPAFDAFVTSVARQMGVALEIGYEILIKNFQASYSASRAALEMAWQFFRRRRAWLGRNFCQVAYEWVIYEAVAAGRLSAPGYFDDPMRRMAWCGAEWIGPARINLDPMKESNADKQDIELGVKTREQVITERTGGDFEAKTRQLAKEENMRRELRAVTPAPTPPAPAAPLNPQPGQAPDDAAEEDAASDDDTENETGQP